LNDDVKQWTANVRVWSSHYSHQKKENQQGSLSKSLHQDKCRVCKKKTTFVCSVCKEENEDNAQHGKETWMGMNKQGQTCFSDHVTYEH
jgi:hypothetical protein